MSTDKTSMCVKSKPFPSHFLDAQNAEKTFCQIPTFRRETTDVLS